MERVFEQEPATAEGLMVESLGDFSTSETELNAMALDRLLDLLSVVSDRSRSRALADELHRRLPKLPRQELVPLLKDQRLADRFDSVGMPCRAAVVKAQLALGWPHALEVEPDDLEYLRGVEAPTGGSGLRSALGVTGVLSLLLNGLVGGMLTLVGLKEQQVMMIAVPFWIAIVHALVALSTVSAIKGPLSINQRGRIRGRLSVLGWMGLIGPLASGIAASIIGGTHDGPSVFLISMAFAFPAMLTALFAALVARKT